MNMPEKITLASEEVPHGVDANSSAGYLHRFLKNATTLELPLKLLPEAAELARKTSWNGVPAYQALVNFVRVYNSSTTLRGDLEQWLVNEVGAYKNDERAKLLLTQMVEYSDGPAPSIVKSEFKKFIEFCKGNPAFFAQVNAAVLDTAEKKKTLQVAAPTPAPRKPIAAPPPPPTPALPPIHVSKDTTLPEFIAQQKKHVGYEIYNRWENYFDDEGRLKADYHGGRLKDRFVSRKKKRVAQAEIWLVRQGFLQGDKKLVVKANDIYKGNETPSQLHVDAFVAWQKAGFPTDMEQETLEMAKAVRPVVSATPTPAPAPVPVPTPAPVDIPAFTLTSPPVPAQAETVAVEPLDVPVAETNLVDVPMAASVMPTEELPAEAAPAPAAVTEQVADTEAVDATDIDFDLTGEEPAAAALPPQEAAARFNEAVAGIDLDLDAPTVEPGAVSAPAETHETNKLKVISSDAEMSAWLSYVDGVYTSPQTEEPVSVPEQALASVPAAEISSVELSGVTPAIEPQAVPATVTAETVQEDVPASSLTIEQITANYIQEVITSNADVSDLNAVWRSQFDFKTGKPVIKRVLSTIWNAQRDPETGAVDADKVMLPMRGGIGLAVANADGMVSQNRQALSDMDKVVLWYTNRAFYEGREDLLKRADNFRRLAGYTPRTADDYMALGWRDVGATEFDGKGQGEGWHSWSYTQETVESIIARSTEFLTQKARDSGVPDAKIESIALNWQRGMRHAWTKYFDVETGQAKPQEQRHYKGAAYAVREALSRADRNDASCMAALDLVGQIEKRDHKLDRHYEDGLKLYSAWEETGFHPNYKMAIGAANRNEILVDLLEEFDRATPEGRNIFGEKEKAVVWYLNRAREEKRGDYHVIAELIHDSKIDSQDERYQSGLNGFNIWAERNFSVGYQQALDEHEAFLDEEAATAAAQAQEEQGAAATDGMNTALDDLLIRFEAATPEERETFTKTEKAVGWCLRQAREKKDKNLYALAQRLYDKETYTPLEDSEVETELNNAASDFEGHEVIGPVAVGWKKYDATTFRNILETSGQQTTALGYALETAWLKYFDPVSGDVRVTREDGSHLAAATTCARDAIEAAAIHNINETEAFLEIMQKVEKRDDHLDYLRRDLLAEYDTWTELGCPADYDKAHEQAFLEHEAEAIEDAKYKKKKSVVKPFLKTLAVGAVAGIGIRAAFALAAKGVTATVGVAAAVGGVTAGAAVTAGVAMLPLLAGMATGAAMHLYQTRDIKREQGTKAWLKGLKSRSGLVSILGGEAAAYVAPIAANWLSENVSWLSWMKVPEIPQADVAPAQVSVVPQAPAVEVTPQSLPEPVAAPAPMAPEVAVPAPVQAVAPPAPQIVAPAAPSVADVVPTRPANPLKDAYKMLASIDGMNPSKANIGHMMEQTQGALKILQDNGLDTSKEKAVQAVLKIANNNEVWLKALIESRAAKLTPG